jgi:hypothetical protein
MLPKFEFESDLQEAIVRALESVHCWPMVNRVVMHRGRPTGLGTGSPDLLVAIPTHGHVWFECKRDAASRPSPEQVAFHARLRLFGQRVYVVRSVTEALACVAAIRAGRAMPVAPVAPAAPPSPATAGDRPKRRRAGRPKAAARPGGLAGAATDMLNLAHSGTRGGL